MSDRLEIANNGLHWVILILNYLIYIYTWMGSVYTRTSQQIRKNSVKKQFVVQRFILIVCNNHVQ